MVTIWSQSYNKFCKYANKSIKILSFFQKYKDFCILRAFLTDIFPHSFLKITKNSIYTCIFAKFFVPLCPIFNLAVLCVSVSILFWLC